MYSYIVITIITIIIISLINISILGNIFSGEFSRQNHNLEGFIREKSKILCMHIHLQLVHRLSKIRTELGEIYLNQVIQTFAVTLIGIFIPIYLLKSGFTLPVSLLFMMVYWITMLILSPFIAKLSDIIGQKHTIILSAPLLMLYFFLLIFVNSIDPFIIAFVGGASAVFYWIPLNSEFIEHIDKLHTGKEVGYLYALPRVATIIAPLLGGIMLTYLGFNQLFTIVIVLIAFSFSPFLLTRDYKGGFPFSLREMSLRPKNILSYLIFSEGLIIMAELLAWPLFIFLTLGNLIIVGASASISGAGIIFFTLFIGKLSDKINRKKLIRIGAVAYAIVWFMRMFVSTELEIYLLSFLGGMFFTLLLVPFYAVFCDFSKRNRISESVVYREIWLSLGRAIPLLLLVMFSLDLIYAFLITGIFTLLFLLFKPI